MHRVEDHVAEIGLGERLDDHRRKVGHDQRDPGLRIIECVAVAEEPIVEEPFTMVGQDDDGGLAAG